MDKKTICIIASILVVLIIAGIIAMINVFGKMKSTSDDKNVDKKVSNSIKNENSESNVEKKNPILTICVKDYGEMKFELYYDDAPESVKLIVALANNHYYDGAKFHRIIKGFMAQGGSRTDKSGPTLEDLGIEGDNRLYSIKGEFSNNNIKNDIKIKKGTIALARTSAPDSASAQFFIMTSNKEVSSIRGRYAAFGQLLEGEDVLDKLNVVKTTGAENSTPVDDITIEKVTVETFGVTYDLPNYIVK